MGEVLSSKCKKSLMHSLDWVSLELATAEQLEEREKQLSLRESRVKELEKKWQSQGK